MSSSNDRGRVGPRLRRMLGLALAGALSAASLAQSESVSARDAQDASVRSYLSGNGLLHRGLYELAVAEYRTFLAENPAHEKADMARYGLAASLFRLGRYDDAVAELDSLRKVSGFEYAPDVAMMLGQCHLSRQRYGPAVEAFRSVIQNFPEHDLADDASAALIEALHLDQRFDEAGQQCQTFVTRWPESPFRERATFFSALSTMAKLDYPAAELQFAEHRKQLPNGAFADQVTLLLAQCRQRGGVADEAVRGYREVLNRENRIHHADALFGLATLLMDQGAWDEAGALLDQLVERFPKSPLLSRACLERGRAYLAQEKFDRAFEAYRQASEASAESADQAAYGMAKSKLRAGEFAEAARRLQEAADRFPQSALHPVMHYDRAIAQLRGGSVDEAIRTLEQFRLRHADHALALDALQLLATAEHQQRRYDRSQAYCRAFREQYSGHAAAASLALLSAENDSFLGRDAEAVEGYRRFLAEYGDTLPDADADEARLRLALTLHRLARFDEAEPLLTQLAPLAKENGAFRSALLALGDIYVQRGEWKQAEVALSEYLSIGLDVPAADDALLKLGLARQRQERVEEALSDYARLLDRFPQSPHRLQALFERGQLLMTRDRSDEAVVAFESVLAENGKDSRFGPYAIAHLGAIAMRRGDFSQAAALYERVARSGSQPDVEAESSFQQGQALMAAGQFESSERIFARLLEHHASHARAPEARARQAIAIARQDRPADALEAMQSVERNGSASLDPALRAALKYEKAWCLRSRGQLVEARDAYRAVLDDAPADAGSYDLHAAIELAELEMVEKRFQEAAEVLRRFLGEWAARPSTASPSSSELHEQGTYRLAVCEFELSNFDAAAERFDGFVKTYPRHPVVASAEYYCGEALFKAGRHEQAVSHLVRVAKEFPTNAVAGPSLLRVGECMAALQRWGPSEQAFADYLDRFAGGEQWFQAEFGLGWAREHQQRFDEAVAAYGRIVVRHQGPTAARAQFQIGQCLFAQKKYEDAVRELLKVDILYAYPEWSAAALFEAGRCFEQLSRPADARTQFSQVAEKHKGTDWAALAATRLAELSSVSALPGR